MSFITKTATLIAKHKEALHQLALQQANSLLIKVSLQLNRVRTATEQKELLNSYYSETLKTLKNLDDEGEANIPFLIELIEAEAADEELIRSTSEQFFGFLGLSPELKNLDFSDIENLALSAIPEDHVAHEILTSYKDYYIQQYFLEMIIGLLDKMDKDGHINEKLTPSEVKEVKGDKVIVLTAAQKILAMHLLMRWSGIELGERQGARHKRFISTLSGISMSVLDEKFPTPAVERKPYHLENLKALIPLFESVNAGQLVERIQFEIDFEQTERL